MIRTDSERAPILIVIGFVILEYLSKTLHHDHDYPPCDCQLILETL